MKYKVNFYDDSNQCVDSIILDASNTEDLYKKCVDYIDEIDPLVTSSIVKGD